MCSCPDTDIDPDSVLSSVADLLFSFGHFHDHNLGCTASRLGQ